jgi:DNA-binding NtrC family response regulator
MLKKEIAEAFASESHKVFRNINGILYSIYSRVCSHGFEDYVAFYLSSNKIPLVNSKYGIQFSSRDDIEENLFNSFFGITGALNEVQNFIDQASQSNMPIMVTGEEGTGKEQAVLSIYTHSLLRHNPLITINCGLIYDKSWSFLTNHYNSPLNDNNNTIYFKNIEKLPESRRKQLLSIIVDMNLCKRNRMIFSCTTNNEAVAAPKSLEFVNLLSCLTLHMPPLRERTDQIPALSSLYLSQLNVMLAKQIIGFEPDALSILVHYDWPYNYMQFKRILNELAVITITPYISTRDVNILIGKEITSSANNSAHSENGSTLNLNRPLDEITREIIQQVLTETGGNQSAAAKQLGISRTTLWRYLK